LIALFDMSPGWLSCNGRIYGNFGQKGFARYRCLLNRFLLSDLRIQRLFQFGFCIARLLEAVHDRNMSNTRKQKRRSQRFDGNEGIDFVRCRICGDYRRVISGRHLAKHGVERKAYMEEYRLSADELIAKAFRMIQSSRKEYRPYGKSDWIAAIRKLYTRDGDISAGYLQNNYPHIYDQGVWKAALISFMFNFSGLYGIISFLNNSLDSWGIRSNSPLSGFAD
jgi:ribosomal protein L32